MRWVRWPIIANFGFRLRGLQPWIPPTSHYLEHETHPPLQWLRVWSRWWECRHPEDMRCIPWGCTKGKAGKCKACPVQNSQTALKTMNSELKVVLRIDDGTCKSCNPGYELITELRGLQVYKCGARKLKLSVTELLECVDTVDIIRFRNNLHLHKRNLCTVECSGVGIRVQHGPRRRL